MDPGPVHHFTADDNPLLSDAPRAFEELVEAAGPGSLMMIIEARMSDGLKRRLGPEDIWQEALISAWEGRTQFEWRGPKSFRAWLLAIIENRIRDAVIHEGAAKRGGGTAPVSLAQLAGRHSTSGSSAEALALIASTTPSRIAAYREEAAAIRVALEALPDEVREVVRLRMFEQLPIAEVAARLGIGESAVRHRLRKGAALYERRMAAVLTTRST
jgi:RNA polymerase sigma-70 factor (ECF subfamily)